MCVSLKEKKFSRPGKLSAHLLLPAILIMTLCVCAVGTIQAQEDLPDADKKGFVGIEVVNSVSPKGVKVVKVLSDSPAQHAGIKPGNVIVKINKSVITSSANFYRAASNLSPGSFIDVGVIQNNLKVTRGLQVGYPPGSKQAEPAFKGNKKQVFGYMESTTTDQPERKQSGGASSLTIIDLTVSQKMVAPGADFEIAMNFFAENVKEKADNVRISMIYTMKKKGGVLIAAKPETLTLPNGMPVSITRTCRAKKEPGSYEILITLEMAGIRAEESVGFTVR